MPAYSIRRLLWGGPTATLVAILMNILYFSVTKALGEKYLIPLTGNASRLDPLSVAMLIIAILVPGLAAAVFFGLLIHFARKPAMIFLSVAITALLVSFGGPFSLPAGTMQTKILLSGMHVIAAVVITGGILFFSRNKNSSPGKQPSKPESSS